MLTVQRIDRPLTPDDRHRLHNHEPFFQNPCNALPKGQGAFPDGQTIILGLGLLFPREKSPLREKGTPSATRQLPVLAWAVANSQSVVDDQQITEHASDSLQPAAAAPVPMALSKTHFFHLSSDAALNPALHIPAKQLCQPLDQLWSDGSSIRLLDMHGQVPPTYSVALPTCRPSQ